MNEREARSVVLVEAYDAAEGPLWSREDRGWATRVAAQSLGAAAELPRLRIERARFALERLQPRDAQIVRWLERRDWRWSWLAFAVVLGLLAGLVADSAAPGRHIDVLAAVPWLIVVWNLAIYAVLLLGALRHDGRALGWFRRLLVLWWTRGRSDGPLGGAARRWAAVTLRLMASRAALLMHAAAAALGAGVIAGLYLRGLVFDFRAGWQSTFLDAPTVQAMLAWLLAPASAWTGIGLPDVAAVEAMRVTAERPSATVSAAPWIHLYAATLALAVTVPRLLLAGWAGLKAARLATRLDPPVDPMLQATLGRGGQPMQVQVLPYAQTPVAQTALGLRDLLARGLGEEVTVKMADVTAPGDEEAAGARAGAGVAMLRVALVDMTATPEDEHHGRFLRAMVAPEPAAASVLLVDEAAYRLRFGSLPGRLDERREAWRAFAQAQGMRLAIVNLDRPDTPEAVQALLQALAA